ncbi:hypothetical protein KIH31_01600 [Paenarthrobacter sp. DKR-5]|uniref:hypothetical protein n=1 Tax=Paenarthrobacter sp. DKR-5 TaxID=2835535 RepID=UPI001BDDC4BF|nr:hypothetical protein [Paenarthrobacter sp. DKR-5]MBT1001284.1 hypothetical protein [Paenarthrobacter sp. DKR-5]
MTDYFTSIGAQTGLYSTGSQWSRIAGTVPSSSNLYAVDSWLAGATNLTSAKRLCSAGTLTAGGRVSIAQYRSSFDYDYSCIG